MKLQRNLDDLLAYAVVTTYESIEQEQELSRLVQRSCKRNLMAMDPMSTPSSVRDPGSTSSLEQPIR